MPMKKLMKKLISRSGYTLMPAGTIPMDVRQMRTLLGLAALYTRVRSVPGAVVECGVGRGRTFLYFAYLIHAEGGTRELWGFDSFEGFPEPTDADQSARAPKAGEWSGISPGDIQTILKTAGISSDFIAKSVHLIPGFFEKSLARYSNQPIAFLHIDADLYDSYREVLAALVPFVSSGGIVLFDEYGEKAWPGATKAVDEFLSGKPWKLERLERSGKYYFVKS